MHHDMSKIIVERPRWHGPFGSTHGRLPRSEDDLSSFEGMRRAHKPHERKNLNDNLAPLRRYLARPRATASTA